MRGEDIPPPGIPESFKVLVKELQSLALDIRVLDENGEEIELSKLIEDDAPSYASIEEVEATVDAEKAGGTADESDLDPDDGEEDDEDEFEDEEYLFDESELDGGSFDDMED